ANAYLDAWAAAARARGVPAIAIAWGPWDGDGLATAAERAYLAERGLRALAPTAALAALDRAIATGAPHLIVADLAWEPFRASLEAWRPRPLLAELGAGAATTTTTAAPAPAMIGMLAGLRPAARTRHLEDWVAHECAGVLGHGDAADLARDRGFFDLGMDSLMAVRLAARLRDGLGIPISPTAIFDQPSITALAARLLVELALGD